MGTNSITYYSTNLEAPEVSFSEALLKGLAPDGGLYMPSLIPKVTTGELENFSSKKYSEIAYCILEKYLCDEIDPAELMSICREAYNFDIPIERVYERNYIMRLDQGPTASFKDFAARMMSRLMQYFLSANNKHLTILTATSGDTGSAVASAFYGLSNINVIILFPEEEVSPLQRKQMTTLNGNIKVIAIKGKFDDCQSLVKKAFMDQGLAGINLSSANSINIGRLLPQTVYYFYAWSRLSSGAEEKAVFSVPSGNFGNLMGGLIAKRMGLPVSRFVISTNANDEVPEFLNSGIYKLINPSKNCISSAMNVGHPSNLSRVLSLYGGVMDEKGNISKAPDLNRMRSELYAVSVSDDETRQTIAEVNRKYSTILEPHGAVAWNGIKKYHKKYKESATIKQLCISLETAHPAKFPEELKNIPDSELPLPLSLDGLEKKDENYVTLENNYDLLKKFILANSIK